MSLKCRVPFNLLLQFPSPLEGLFSFFLQMSPTHPKLIMLPRSSIESLRIRRRRCRVKNRPTCLCSAANRRGINPPLKRMQSYGHHHCRGRRLRLTGDISLSADACHVGVCVCALGEERGSELARAICQAVSQRHVLPSFASLTFRLCWCRG